MARYCLHCCCGRFFPTCEWLPLPARKFHGRLTATLRTVVDSCASSEQRAPHAVGVLCAQSRVFERLERIAWSIIGSLPGAAPWAIARTTASISVRRREGSALRPGRRHPESTCRRHYPAAT